MAVKYKKVAFVKGHRGVGSGASGFVDEVWADNIQCDGASAYMKGYPITIYHEPGKLEVNGEVDWVNRIHREVGIDLAVAFHDNAGKGDGAEMLVYSRKSASVPFAKAIAQEVKELGQNLRSDAGYNDGLKVRPELYFLRGPKNIPSIITELFFVDNKTDSKIGDTKQKNLELGYAVARGILKGFGIKDNGYQNGGNKPKPPTTDKPPTTTPSKPSKVDEDGKWGKQLTGALQKNYKTYIDKKVSNQPTSNKKFLPNCFSIKDGGAWEFKEVGYKDGSNLISAMERDLTSSNEYSGKIDGWAGTAFAKGLQKKLKRLGFYKGELTGKLDKPTVLALQKYLNS